MHRLSFASVATLLLVNAKDLGFMDRHIPSASRRDLSGYSELSDEQLHYAIRFAEQHLQGLEDGRASLKSAYRDEVAAMRGQLVDRALSRLLAEDAPLTKSRRRALERLASDRGMEPDDTALAVRATTNGRADRLEALTQMESTVLIFRLERPR